MGVEGYELKLWHHDVNKPLSYGIHKDVGKKPRHFLDDIMRQKKIVPPPNQYTIAKDLSIKNNMMVSKAPRTTVAVEIENIARRNKYPDAATYQLNHK